jgi:2-dehydro-3-deoxygluconokinase
MTPDDVDWDHLFGELGVRWFHTGGILTALSNSTFRTAKIAMETARRHGTAVSYDANYRPSLWRSAGGSEAHRRMTDQLLPYIDVLFGTEPDTDVDTSTPSIVARTERIVRSASVHDWSGTAWSTATGMVAGTRHTELQVFDRIGSGDAFAAGVIHGLLTERPLAHALELGIAHGALVMTTPGDTSSMSIAEVEHLASAGADDIAR